MIEVQVCIDVTCPSVVTRAALPAACHMPLATAIAAAAMEHARYGDVHPHTALPFVVEHAGAGGINCNKEGMQFFRMCRDAADSKLNTRASGLPSWFSKGVSNLFLQSLSLANLKGLGHLFMVTAASIKSHAAQSSQHPVCFSRLLMINQTVQKPRSGTAWQYAFAEKSSLNNS